VISENVSLIDSRWARGTLAVRGWRAWGRRRTRAAGGRRRRVR
jgi:hypothetical protein